MADVYVDTQKLNDTINAYARCRQDLESMISSLKSGINTLESRWKGLASDSFSINHFPQVCSSMEEQIKKIEGLEKELRSVATEFAGLDRDIKNLEF